MRVSELLNWEVLPKLELRDFIYFVGMMAVPLAIYESGVHVEKIMSVYGSVGGFLTITAMPIFVHLRCVFVKLQSGWIR